MDVMPVRQQAPRQVEPDKAGSSGNEYLHKVCSCQKRNTRIVLSAIGTCGLNLRIQLLHWVTLRYLKTIRGGILAFSSHQFLVRTLLDDSAGAQVDDSIGLAYGG